MEQNEKISTFPSKPLRVGYSALVLDHDSNNIYYLRDKLIQPISELETGESTFAKLHHNKFGENSLWPKLDYIHGLK